MKGESCQQSVYSHPTKTAYFKKHCIWNLPYVCHCNRKLKATVLVVNLEVILTYNVIKGLTFFINHVSSNLLGLKTKTPVGSRKSKPPRGALAPTPLLAGKNSCGSYSASSQRQKGKKKKKRKTRKTYCPTSPRPEVSFRIVSGTFAVQAFMPGRKVNWMNSCSDSIPSSTYKSKWLRASRSANKSSKLQALT